MYPYFVIKSKNYIIILSFNKNYEILLEIEPVVTLVT